MINKLNIARNIIGSEQKNLSDMQPEKDSVMINKYNMQKKRTFFSGSLSGVSNTASS